MKLIFVPGADLNRADDVALITKLIPLAKVQDIVNETIGIFLENHVKVLASPVDPHVTILVEKDVLTNSNAGGKLIAALAAAELEA